MKGDSTPRPDLPALEGSLPFLMEFNVSPRAGSARSKFEIASRPAGLKVWAVLILGAIAGGIFQTPVASAELRGSVEQQEAPTFARDVAPILFDRCSSCHHPGGAGPFSLLSWEEARNRARQIADVTASRYMPPWLPEPDPPAFAEERRLSGAEIATLASWAAAGAPLGKPRDLPPVPVYKAGWQMGEPDLVLTMPATYNLKAEGADVIRYFAIPNPLSRERFVRGFEFRPGNSKIVHHARIVLDLSGLTERLDLQDPEPGFARGMNRAQISDPDGHWLGWTPGKQPAMRDPELAWRLDPGTVLVLELHLVPSGKPESIQSSLGLYFSDKPPMRRPVILRFGSLVIDIPAGDSEYSIQDDYKLPISVEILNVYPHAHLLATEMESWATLPDGSRRNLIHIKRWNFDWQDEYRYRSPVKLPKGTVLSMRYRYDNSANNVRNPYNPPRRVVWGEQTINEMGDLWFQVLPSDPEERDVLSRHFGSKEDQAWKACYVHQLQVDPGDADAHFNLGTTLIEESEMVAAMRHLKEAVRIDPRHTEAHFNLASAYEEQGNLEKARTHFSRVIELSPDFGRAHGRLGVLLAADGDWKEAETHFRRTLDLIPTDPLTRNNLGVALLWQERFDEAEDQFQYALRIQEFADPHYNLGTLFAMRRDWPRAEFHLRKAIDIRPSFAEAYNDLGNVYAEQGKWKQAEEQFERALAADAGLTQARESLQQVRALQKRQP